MRALIQDIATTLASSEAHARLVTLRGFGRFARAPDGRITFKMSARLRRKRGKA